MAGTNLQAVLIGEGLLRFHLRRGNDFMLLRGPVIRQPFAAFAIGEEAAQVRREARSNGIAQWFLKILLCWRRLPISVRIQISPGLPKRLPAGRSALARSMPKARWKTGRISRPKALGKEVGIWVPVHISANLRGDQGVGLGSILQAALPKELASSAAVNLIEREVIDVHANPANLAGMDLYSCPPLVSGTRPDVLRVHLNHLASEPD